MTYEEALDDLKYCKCEVTKDKFVAHLKHDTVRLSIKALDKQIPKKLKHEQDWYTCPNCEEIVIRFDDEPKDENYQYCSWCGQRLDRRNA